jgi:ABC-type phosphate/phosphonate transport system substrate-binding protein
MRRAVCPGLAVLTAALFLGFVSTRTHADNQTPTRVQIGMVGSLFTDVPKPLVNILMHPFKALMKEHTGLDGDTIIGGDAYHVGRQVVEDKLHLGVFHGHEFAWAQQKYPNLRPLMIAVSTHRHLRVRLVVNAESKSASFADVKGKDLAFAYRSKEPCRVFLDRSCGECGQANPKAFFKQITTPANVEAALDDVCGGTVEATIVDDVSLECYEQIKPGCFARLKVIKDSPLFPAGVIAYRHGALDEEMLRRFRDGMSNANKTERGRELMNLFKITAFEPVPADYNQVQADFVKAYPAPEAKVAP